MAVFLHRPVPYKSNSNTAKSVGFNSYLATSFLITSCHPLQILQCIRCFLPRGLENKAAHQFSELMSGLCIMKHGLPLDTMGIHSFYCTQSFKFKL